MNRLLLAAALALAPAVLADLVVPQESACRELKAGAACRGEFGEGVCTASTCTRNDYSEGVPPKQKVVDCLKCLPRPERPDGGTPAPKPKKPKWGSAP